MKCTHPVWIQDEMTGGNTTVPCGRCIPCRLNYAQTWAIRMMHELKYWEKACFVTLTYSEENIPRGNSLVKQDVQNFIKRLRKNTGRKIKYFFSGEYGENYHRPHYHAIIYGVDKSESKEVEKAWNSGYVFVGSVTHDSCNYVAKYITKKLTGELAKVYGTKGIISEFSLMSKKPGIGAKFVEQYGREMMQRECVIVKGSKVGIPRYYKKLLCFEGGNKIMLHLKKENEKVLDKIKNEGYISNDVEEKLAREASEIKCKGKLNLKRSKV